MRYFDCHSHFSHTRRPASPHAWRNTRTPSASSSASASSRPRSRWPTASANAERPHHPRHLPHLADDRRGRDPRLQRLRGGFARSQPRRRLWQLARHQSDHEGFLDRRVQAARSPAVPASSASARARTASAFRRATRFGTRSTSCRSRPRLPVLLMCGLTGIGQGLPGGTASFWTTATRATSTGSRRAFPS